VPTASAIKGDSLNFVKPGVAATGNASQTLSTNLVGWTQNYILTPLYKLRRWYWLNAKATITSAPFISTYTVPNVSEAIFLVSATSGGTDLLIPPISQAEAFYAGSGPPEGVALVPGNPITQVQVFPTPDGAGPYFVNLDVTQPFVPLVDDGLSHNYLTDAFPLLVLSGMNSMAFLFLQEEGLFNYWFGIYASQVRALATYDHEVRRGGTMPEPFDPFVPTLGAITGQPTPQTAGVAATG
jgi:hypothetical protein